MNKRTEAALRASIKHWEENANIARMSQADLGISSCALCDLFWNVGCTGCPIFDATLQQRCEGTPYYAASDAHENNDLPAFLEAAQAELEFLRSLLPNQES